MRTAMQPQPRLISPILGVVGRILTSIAEPLILVTAGSSLDRVMRPEL